MLSITHKTMIDRMSNRADNIVRGMGRELLHGLAQIRCIPHPLCFVSGAHYPAGSKRTAYEPESTEPIASWPWATTWTTFARAISRSTRS